MSKEISLQQPGRRVTIGLHEKKEKLNNPIKTTSKLNKTRQARLYIKNESPPFPIRNGIYFFIC